MKNLLLLLLLTTCQLLTSFDSYSKNIPLEETPVLSEYLDDDFISQIKSIEIYEESETFPIYKITTEEDKVVYLIIAADFAIKGADLFFDIKNKICTQGVDVINNLLIENDRQDLILDEDAKNAVCTMLDLLTLPGGLFKKGLDKMRKKGAKQSASLVEVDRMKKVFYMMGDFCTCGHNLYNDFLGAVGLEKAKSTWILQGGKNLAERGDNLVLSARQEKLIKSYKSLFEILEVVDVIEVAKDTKELVVKKLTKEKAKNFIEDSERFHKDFGSNNKAEVVTIGDNCSCDGSAKVSDEYSGMFNILDEEVTELDFQDITQVTQNHYLAKLDGKFGFIDENKNIIYPFELDVVERFQEFPQEEVIFMCQKDGQYGVLNNKIQTVVPIEFDKWVRPMPNDVLENSTNTKFFEVIKNGKHGFYNDKGEVVMEVKYKPFGIEEHFYADAFICDDFFVFQQKGKYGLRNFNGKIIIKAVYDELIPWNEKLIFAKKDGKTGLLNNNNQTVIPLSSDVQIAILPREQFLRVQLGKQISYYAKTGNLLITPIEVTNVKSPVYYGIKGNKSVYKYSVSGKEYYVYGDGSPITSDVDYVIDRDIKDYNDGGRLCLFSTNQKKGLVKISNSNETEIVIEPVYDEITYLSERKRDGSGETIHVIVKSNNKYGLIKISEEFTGWSRKEVSRDKEVVYELKYDNLYFAKVEDNAQKLSDRLVFELNGDIGFIEGNEEKILFSKSNVLNNFKLEIFIKNENYIVFSVNYECKKSYRGLLDMKGNIVMPQIYSWIRLSREKDKLYGDFYSSVGNHVFSLNELGDNVTLEPNNNFIQNTPPVKNLITQFSDCINNELQGLQGVELQNFINDLKKCRIFMQNTNFKMFTGYINELDKIIK